MTANTEKHMVLLGASYTAEWDQPQLPGYRITNKGIGGQESSDLRARFEQDVLALKPDVVMIWGHYNDVVRAPADNVQPAIQRAQDNFRNMMQQAQDAGIEVILVTELTRPIVETWKYRAMSLLGKLRGKEHYNVRINRHIKHMNEWLREYARMQNVKLLDLEKALDSGNGTRSMQYTREDNSHVSPAGYQAITQYTQKQLASWNSRTPPSLQ